MPTEATFLLAGLFVVAAASGWAFARFNAVQREESSVAPASADYIRGLNNRQRALRLLLPALGLAVLLGHQASPCVQVPGSS